MAMFTKEFIQKYSGLMVTGVLFLSVPIIAIASIEDSSQANEISTAEDAAANAKEAADEWEYVFENRPDPFLPFIKPKVATQNIPEEEEVILTGMQLFEPGQLKLVAIMFSPGSKVAMVEDVTGKGYVINEGMLIGRYGIISQINLDQVNITETRRVAGKDVVTPIVMRLNKEGDQ